MRPFPFQILIHSELSIQYSSYISYPIISIKLTPVVRPVDHVNMVGDQCDIPDFHLLVDEPCRIGGDEHWAAHIRGHVSGKSLMQRSVPFVQMDPPIPYQSASAIDQTVKDLLLVANGSRNGTMGHVVEANNHGVRHYVLGYLEQTGAFHYWDIYLVDAQLGKDVFSSFRKAVVVLEWRLNGCGK